MGEIEIIETSVTLAKLTEIAKKSFGEMVKAVVDVEKKIMAVGGELHADEEAVLLDRGSKQNDLWGINIYVSDPPESRIEFDSMVNIRPSQGNLSRKIQDQGIQAKITEIVNSLIT